MDNNKHEEFCNEINYAPKQSNNRKMINYFIEHRWDQLERP